MSFSMIFLFILSGIYRRICRKLRLETNDQFADDIFYRKVKVTVTHFEFNLKVYYSSSQVPVTQKYVYKVHFLLVEFCFNNKKKHK